MKFILILFIVMLNSPCFAQEESREELQRQVDAAQRTQLKDSLGSSDATITELFAIRDHFFAQSDAVYANGALSFSEQQTRIKVLRRQTDAAFKNLLGEVAYQRYKEFIAARLKQRKINGRQPLTLDSL